MAQCSLHTTNLKLQTAINKTHNKWHANLKEDDCWFHHALLHSLFYFVYSYNSFAVMRFVQVAIY